MIDLIGTYECKLDASGRFMFPKQFITQLGDAAVEGMVIKRSVFKQCLELFPLQNWKKETKKLKKLDMFDPKSSEFMTKFMAGVNVVEFDTTGRLLIPKNLIAFGKIEKKITLTAALNRIEIWDKNIYEDTMNYTQEEFAKLTVDVMENLNKK